MHTCTMWCYKLIADTVPQEGWPKSRFS
jgi:hypothetical protein